MGQNSVAFRGDAITVDEAASVPGGNPSAGDAKVWVQNLAPNVVGFTRDDGRQAALSNKKWALLTLSADQTSNLSINQHIEFDTIIGNGLTLQTGAGQADGIIELTQNHTYLMFAQAHTLTSISAGSAFWSFFDRDNAVTIGVDDGAAPISRNLDAADTPGIVTIFQADTVDHELEYRLTGTSGGVSRVFSANAFWLIVEIGDAG